MKKLLGILLATAAIFSTTAFASPTAEPIESADEISLEIGGGAVSPKISDASLAEETVSYYDPALGVKIIGDDFETWGSDTSTDNITKLQNQYVAQGGKMTIADGGDGHGNVLQFNVDGTNQWSAVYINFGYWNNYYKIAVPATFTFSAQYRYNSENFAVAPNPQLRMSDSSSQNSYDSFANGTVSGIGSTNVWLSHETNPTYAFDGSDGKEANAIQLTFDLGKNLAGYAGKECSVQIDNLYLYYMPTTEEKYSGIEFNFPTVTVKTENGFEENAVKALTANPEEYLSKAVSSVEFTDGNMVIHLDEGATSNYDSFTIPSLVNGTKTAVYPETKIEFPDYFAPIYGLKNYFWNAGSESTDNVTVFETSLAKVEHEFKSDADIGKYVSVVNKNDSGNSKINLTGKRNTNLPYGTAHTYTYITKMKIDAASGSKIGLTLRSCSGGGAKNAKNASLTNHAWGEVKIDYSLDDDEVTKAISRGTQCPDLYIGDFTQIDVAYVGLYYKPVEKASASLKTTGKNTAAVTYDEGIYKTQTAALETYFKKYFEGNVTALTVSGNVVTLTLADGVESVTMPALVSADGTATYDEVVVSAPVYPISDESLTTIRANYPAGLRFQSHFAVGYMVDENLTEFGYVVARKEILGETVLTAEKDSVNKIVSASYKRDESLNKFDYDAENVTFAAVLVNIPKDHYKDQFAVRPYVVYGGQYFYGETMTKSIYEVAESLKEGASESVAKVIEKILSGQELDKYSAK